jgi:hypothetical protein
MESAKPESGIISDLLPGFLIRFDCGAQNKGNGELEA